MSDDTGEKGRAREAFAATRESRKVFAEIRFRDGSFLYGSNDLGRIMDAFVEM